MADDLSANSSRSVTPVGGKFFRELRSRKQKQSIVLPFESCGKELEPLECVNAWLGDKQADKDRR